MHRVCVWKAHCGRGQSTHFIHTATVLGYVTLILHMLNRHSDDTVVSLLCLTQKWHLTMKSLPRLVSDRNGAGLQHAGVEPVSLSGGAASVGWMGTVRPKGGLGASGDGAECRLSRKPPVKTALPSKRCSGPLGQACRGLKFVPPCHL